VDWAPLLMVAAFCALCARCSDRRRHCLRLWPP
jgi:hypothetical protein